MSRLCVVGSGGFAKEVACLAHVCGYDIDCFVDVEEKCDVNGLPVKAMGYLDTKFHCVVVAIGNPVLRRKVIQGELPDGIKHVTLVHPHVNVWNRFISVGDGSIICEGVILTCNIDIGPFSHLNLNTTVGHDVKTGAYFTTAPGVHISGNATIGEAVYFGTNSSTVERLSLADEIVIGAGACVVGDLAEKGTYVGVPAKRLLRIV